jgi:hypothetical protein
MRAPRPLGPRKLPPRGLGAGVKRLDLAFAGVGDKVRDDGQEPRRRLSRTADVVPRQCAHGAQERLLGEILDVGSVAERAGHEGEHQRLVAHDEPAQRGRIAVAAKGELLLAHLGRAPRPGGVVEGQCCRSRHSKRLHGPAGEKLHADGVGHRRRRRYTALPVKSKLISCEIFYREICAIVARSPHRVDVEFLPKGLHDMGATKMLARLQERVSAVDASAYDRLLLGYGLCNRGITGLRAPAIPIVVPRAHDCITLFFGSLVRQTEYYAKRPGAYFLTSGWIERGGELGELGPASIQAELGLDVSYASLVEKYGEEDAKELMADLGNMLHNYSRIAFIEMGVERGLGFEDEARRQAGAKGWELEKIAGDAGMLERLVNGPHDDAEFLVVPPGQRIVDRHDGTLIAAAPQTE